MLLGAAFLSFSSMAMGQVKESFLNSGSDFLDSAFCKQYKCFSAGSIKINETITEEYYAVTGFKNPKYGQERYLVFFNKCKGSKNCNNVWTRAGLRYLPAQDKTEDGAFAIEFFSFVSGVPLHAYPAERLFNGCINAIRGKTEYFFVDSGKAIPLTNSNEEIITLNPAYAYGSSWFDNESPTTRVAISKMCNH